MKIVFKLITLFTILACFYMLIPAYSAFVSITTDPEGWMGGISAESTLVWFAILILGFGYLAFSNILALIGWLFGGNSRKAGFWLFKLPGILGIVLSILLAISMYLWDIDWSAHYFVILLIFVPFLVFTLFGNYLRKSIPKKNS